MVNKCLIIAGESSGDKYGKNLIIALRSHFKEIEIFAIGGKHIQSTDVNLIETINKLTVVGLVEVLKHLPVVKKTLDKIKNFLEKEKPDFIILIDYPDFNFRVAKYAKKFNIPVFYFVCPQVWAWRQKRIKFLKKYVTKLFVIFPFEEHFYKKFNIHAKFVGHPLAENIKNFKFSSTLNKKSIALLPGSRMSEIKKLLPIMLESVKLIKKEYPDMEFSLILAPSLNYSDISGYITTHNSNFVKIIEYNDYDTLKKFNLFISASGTATLEIALLGKPVIIIYKVNLLSYIIGKLLIKVKYIGMPNILLGIENNPELIQYQVTPFKIFLEVKKFLRNKLKYKIVSQNNQKLLTKLYKKDVFKNTIKEISQFKF